MHQPIKLPACPNSGAKRLARFAVGTVLVGLALSSSVAHATSLSILINSILEVHPSLRAQRALGASSQEAINAARWQYFPTLSVNTEKTNASTRDPLYGHGDSRVTTLRLQQPIWTGGRLTANFTRAEAGLLAANAGLEVTRQDLALRILQTYADWYSGYAKTNAYEKSLQAHLRLREQIVQRIEQGVSAASDLTLVAGRIEQTQADLTASKAQQQTAISRLSQLLGKSVGAADLVLDRSKPLVLPDVSERMVEDAQSYSPTISRLFAEVQIQEADVASRRASLSPEVYVRAERQYGNFSLAGAAPQNRVFFGLSSNFGAGLSALSEVSGAKARLEAAQADVESARVSLGEQIWGDSVLAMAGNARRVSLIASLRSAQAVSQAWGRQFLAGQKTWIDVMNAARELAQVEVQMADLEATQLLLTWRLVIVVRGVDTATDPLKSPETKEIE
jgi:adhesin transport system outer membrane protein